MSVFAAFCQSTTVNYPPVNSHVDKPPVLLYDLSGREEKKERSNV
jgi:hypothetical protein